MDGFGDLPPEAFEMGFSVSQGGRRRFLTFRLTGDREQWRERWTVTRAYARAIRRRRLFGCLGRLLRALYAAVRPAWPPSLITAPQAEGTTPAGALRFTAVPCTPHAPPAPALRGTPPP